MKWHNIARTGLLPRIILEDDPRPAREQINERYAHGGGWQPFDGFKLVTNSTVEEWHLQYPDDPPMRYLAHTRLRDEMIILFESSWVAIVAHDGSYEIARMD